MPVESECLLSSSAAELDFGYESRAVGSTCEQVLYLTGADLEGDSRCSKFDLEIPMALENGSFGGQFLGLCRARGKQLGLAARVGDDRCGCARDHFCSFGPLHGTVGVDRDHLFPSSLVKGRGQSDGREFTLRFVAGNFPRKRSV